MQKSAVYSGRERWRSCATCVALVFFLLFLVCVPGFASVISDTVFDAVLAPQGPEQGGEPAAPDWRELVREAWLLKGTSVVREPGGARCWRRLSWIAGRNGCNFCGQVKLFAFRGRMCLYSMSRKIVSRFVLVAMS
jgi:hypothetical protein